MSNYTGRRALGKKNNTRRSKAVYIDGNTVRKTDELDVRVAIKEPYKGELSHAARKNRDKARHMNLGYVAFLAIAMAVMMVSFYGYISLQASNKAMIAQIASMESELNTMKLDNDEEYSRIMSSVDMQHVKEVAMGQLGMCYAQEGQILNVEGSGDDYVSQHVAMPK
ncbi:MAG: cell division protein FtsL [Lachnospiraceae bacterium]|nr:cell division protein FtsL [Lachnospiraceae bacterium]